MLLSKKLINLGIKVVKEEDNIITLSSGLFFVKVSLVTRKVTKDLRTTIEKWPYLINPMHQQEAWANIEMDYRFNKLLKIVKEEVL